MRSSEGACAVRCQRSPQTLHHRPTARPPATAPDRLGRLRQRHAATAASLSECPDTGKHSISRRARRPAGRARARLAHLPHQCPGAATTQTTARRRRRRSKRGFTGCGLPTLPTSCARWRRPPCYTPTDSRVPGDQGKLGARPTRSRHCERGAPIARGRPPLGHRPGLVTVPRCGTGRPHRSRRSASQETWSSGFNPCAAIGPRAWRRPARGHAGKEARCSPRPARFSARSA